MHICTIYSGCRIKLLLVQDVGDAQPCRHVSDYALALFPERGHPFGHCQAAGLHFCHRCVENCHRWDQLPGESHIPTFLELGVLLLGVLGSALLWSITSCSHSTTSTAWVSLRRWMRSWMFQKMRVSSEHWFPAAGGRGGGSIEYTGDYLIHVNHMFTFVYEEGPAPRLFILRCDCAELRADHYWWWHPKGSFLPEKKVLPS